MESITTTLNFNKLNISIHELKVLKNILELTGKAFVTCDESMLANKELICTKIYTAYRFTKDALHLVEKSKTKHNYTFRHNRTGLANYQAVDDSFIRSYGQLDISLTPSTNKDFKVHKELIMTFMSIEDTIFDLSNLSNLNRHSYLEYLSVSRILLIEARFLIEFSLETKYKEKVDFLKD